ncbi:hypothetical protein NMY22_g4446 [Coprinellus aureogranulatus]|nr:hypothetical protein NMY22_g4446 [Coprinellus aureogranulatus]
MFASSSPSPPPSQPTDKDSRASSSNTRQAQGGSGSGKENQPLSAAGAARVLVSLKRPVQANDDLEIFTRGRAKQHKADPLIHYGRHFGRTIRAFCRVHTLLKNGVNRTMEIELGRLTIADLGAAERAEHDVYQRLLALVPGLEERLNTGTANELIYIADMITKGASTARSDDTKNLKSAVIDWITPPNGYLQPPLQRNIKTDRGFLHPRTGELLCPTNLNWDDPKIRRDLASGHLVPSGDLWPRFLYRGYQYNPDDPWDGLLRSSILVSARFHVPKFRCRRPLANRATRSSNARIHGMTFVTIPSIAYIATQVRFALSSAPTFSRTDTVTDSEYFYFLIIDLLEDPEEQEEIDSLLRWWNQQIFPANISETRAVHKESVIARIKERRRKLQDGTLIAPPRPVLRPIGSPEESGGGSRGSDGSSGSSTPTNGPSIAAEHEPRPRVVDQPAKALERTLDDRSASNTKVVDAQTCDEFTLSVEYSVDSDFIPLAMGRVKGQSITRSSVALFWLFGAIYVQNRRERKTGGRACAGCVLTTFGSTGLGIGCQGVGEGCWGAGQRSGRVRKRVVLTLPNVIVSQTKFSGVRNGEDETLSPTLSPPSFSKLSTVPSFPPPSLLPYPSIPLSAPEYPMSPRAFNIVDTSLLLASGDSEPVAISAELEARLVGQPSESWLEIPLRSLQRLSTSSSTILFHDASRPPNIPLRVGFVPPGIGPGTADRLRDPGAGEECDMTRRMGCALASAIGWHNELARGRVTDGTHPTGFQVGFVLEKSQIEVDLDTRPPHPQDVPHFQARQIMPDPQIPHVCYNPSAPTRTHRQLCSLDPKHPASRFKSNANSQSSTTRSLLSTPNNNAQYQAHVPLRYLSEPTCNLRICYTALNERTRLLSSIDSAARVGCAGRPVLMPSTHQSTTEMHDLGHVNSDLSSRLRYTFNTRLCALDTSSPIRVFLETMIVTKKNYFRNEVKLPNLQSREPRSDLNLLRLRVVSLPSSAQVAVYGRASRLQRNYFDSELRNGCDPTVPPSSWIDATDQLSHHKGLLTLNCCVLTDHPSIQDLYGGYKRLNGTLSPLCTSTIAMPLHQAPRIQTPDIRIMLSHFIRQVEARHVRTKTQRPAPLHFDSKTGGLVEFYWPCKCNPETEEVERVTPSDLESLRRTHEFQAPCCLCAFIDGEDYTESQIGIVEVLTKDEDRNKPILNGEIVAQCARQRCGYLLCLERFYPLYHLQTRVCHPRTIPLPIQDLIHISDIEKSFRRGDGLFQVMPDVVTRGHRAGPEMVDPRETKMIRNKLISDLMVGVSEARFWAIFVQCLQCRNVMFREHFAANHKCSEVTQSKERKDTRYHPYRRGGVRYRTTRIRAQASLETLFGDEPEPTSPVSLQRTSTVDTTLEVGDQDLTLNPSDFADGTDSEDDTTDSDTARAGIRDTAANDDQPTAWWVHSPPPLPPSDDDDFIPLSEILRNSRSIAARTSNTRTYIGERVNTH